MQKVNIYIESTWAGPARKDGVAMWLVECKRGDRLDTRQGFVHVEDGTEIQGSLMAIINAFCILRKPCSALVFTKCSHVLNMLRDKRYLKWQEDGWVNARGRPVKNAGLWEMLLEKGRCHTYQVQSGYHEYENIMKSDLRRELERWKGAKK